MLFVERVMVNATTNVDGVNKLKDPRESEWLKFVFEQLMETSLRGTTSQLSLPLNFALHCQRRSHAALSPTLFLSLSPSQLSGDPLPADNPHTTARVHSASYLHHLFRSSPAAAAVGFRSTTFNVFLALSSSADLRSTAPPTTTTSDPTPLASSRSARFRPHSRSLHRSRRFRRHLFFTGDNTLIRSICCSFNRLLPAPVTSLVFSSIFASRNLAGLLSLTGADLAGNLKLAGKDSLIDAPVDATCVHYC
ncbi:hypothetical protein LXL04_017325 [Taraxacum kok-saghyz]